MLDKLNPSSREEAKLVAEYRILSLVALGRRDDATRTIEHVLRTDPFYRPSAEQVPPSIQAMINDVRRQFIPTLALNSYAEAKAAYERKDPRALKDFEQVLALLDDPDAQGVAVLNDLRTVVAGFRDLSKALAAPPPAAAPKPDAPRAVPAPAEAASGSSAGTEERGTPAPEPGVSPVSGTRPAASATPAPHEAANAATAPGSTPNKEGAAVPAKPSTPPTNARSTGSVSPSAEKLVYGVDDVDVNEPMAVIQRFPVWTPVRTEPKTEFKGLLQIIIDRSGNVTSAEMRISAHPTYDADLIRMARGWKFKPASKNGVRVAYTKLIAISLRPYSGRNDD